MYITACTFALYNTSFFIIKPYFPEVRILNSLINSTLLSIYGIYYFGKIQQNTVLSDYITGYFVYDLYTGHFYDRQNFQLLTGYIHHNIYITLLSYIRYTNQTYLINSFLPFEIPTALLDLRKMYRNNLLNTVFGVNFFAFRIIYNIYIVKKMYAISMYYSVISTAMLLVHSYWFYKWIQNRFQKNICNN